jgi:hypothetical protein
MFYKKVFILNFIFLFLFLGLSINKGSVAAEANTSESYFLELCSQKPFLPVCNNLLPDSGFGAVGESSGRIINVNSIITLRSAIQSARPGDKIQIAAGVYSQNSGNLINISGLNGTPGNPITITGLGNPVFRTNQYENGTGFLIDNSSHFIIENITIRTILRGLRVTNSSNFTIRGLTVFDIGQEAMNTRQASSNGLFAYNRIYDTGKRGSEILNGVDICFNLNTNAQQCESRTWAEGIYVGSGNTGGENDGTTNILVFKNHISNTGSEAIDLKRGLSNLYAKYNYINDVTSKNRSIINVQEGPIGNEQNIVIEGNYIENSAGGLYFTNGNAIRVFSPNAEIYNNIIFKSTVFGIRSEVPANVADRGTVRIYNNTVIDGGVRGDIVNSSGNVDIRNNLTTGDLANNRDAVENYANGDFRPRCVSPSSIIDQGQSSNSVIDSFGRTRNSPVDLGAYESNCNPIQTPVEPTPTPIPVNNSTTVFRPRAIRVSTNQNRFFISRINDRDRITRVVIEVRLPTQNNRLLRRCTINRNNVINATNLNCAYNSAVLRNAPRQITVRVTDSNNNTEVFRYNAVRNRITLL